MKYFTKEWYALCQKTFLHFDLKACAKACEFSEDLYLRLYQKEEAKFILQQREIYDIDIEDQLIKEGVAMVDLDKFFSGYTDQDVVFSKLTEEDIQQNKKMRAEFKNRPPFNVENIRNLFAEIYHIDSNRSRDTLSKLPDYIRNLIADERVFLLGYATQEIIKLLKVESRKNKIEVERTLRQAHKSAQSQNLPTSLKKLCFHDCQVVQLKIDRDICIEFDNRSGFTNLNKILFINAEIIEIEDDILNSVWLYDEIYKIARGYEVHVLFSGDRYLTLYCTDIQLL